MSNSFAIARYPDAEDITEQLDKLIKKPIYGINHDALKKYEKEYYGKCVKSKEISKLSTNVIPNGFQHDSVGTHPFPLTFNKAEGNKLYDIDGNEYYDFLQSGGTSVLGTNPKPIRDEIAKLMESGNLIAGLFNEYEYKLADKIVECVPSVDRFRMFSSVTDACMCAVRVARLATGKKNILKLGGANHGSSDQLAYGIKIPGSNNMLSNGVPNFVFKHTEEFYPNDLDDLEHKLKMNQLTGGTAAIFLEPFGPQSGTRPLSKTFVKGVELLCHKHGTLLIFDETVTGFRIGLSGAQGYFDIKPDLTIFGNVVAGGYFPAGGIGGRKEIMAHLGSINKKIKKAVCDGAALSPLAYCAGYHTICEIERTNACKKDGELADRLIEGIRESIDRHNLPFVTFNYGSICHLDTVGTMGIRLDKAKPWELSQMISQAAMRQTAQLHMAAAYMAEGMVTPTGGLLYTSSAYSEDEIDDAIARFDKIFDNCSRLG